MKSGAEQLLVRIDSDAAEEAIRAASRIRDQVGGYVIGINLLMDRGPILVGAVRALDKPVLADLGVLDRPRAMARAVAAMARLGARWVSVSGLAGRRALAAAAEEAEQYPDTSVVVSARQAGWAGDEDLKGVGITDTPGSHVSRLTKLAEQIGAGGILFPARELGVVVQVADARKSPQADRPGALARFAELPDDAPRSAAQVAIRGGAHWVVATGEQFAQMHG